MKLFSRFGFVFLKKNFQIVYATILLLLIPAAVVLNSVIFIRNTQKIIDTELQRKANLAEQVFVKTISSAATDPLILQRRVNEVTSISDDIYGLDILVPDGENFRVVASLDPDAVSTTTSFLNNTIAWKTGGSIAYSTLSESRSPALEGKVPDRGKNRYWVVTGPLYSVTGEKVGLVSMKISSQIIDQLTQQNLNRSIVILLITIVIIILLLFNNTRLFEYAMLFRKLKEVDQMKDEFISIASHELRAPLTGIRGYLDMILAKELGPVSRTVREKLEMVQDATERLHELVEDLLDVSRIEQGRLVMKTESLDAVSILRQIVDQFSALAKEKRIGLALEAPRESIPHVLGDEQKFRQVMINLIGNAVKYTPKGSVRVTATVKEDTMEIKVIDTGLGMSGKEREHLFEKFYRIRNRQTANIPGTGLGLWITHELVGLMKGSIYVDSIERVGTQVAVILPLDPKSFKDRNS